MNSNRQKVSLDALEGKFIGVLFSAHWSPTCRAFIPKLVNFRNMNASLFEVVFVALIVMKIVNSNT